MLVNPKERKSSGEFEPWKPDTIISPKSLGIPLTNEIKFALAKLEIQINNMISKQGHNYVGMGQYSKVHRKI